MLGWHKFQGQFSKQSNIHIATVRAHSRIHAPVNVELTCTGCWKYGWYVVTGLVLFSVVVQTRLTVCDWAGWTPCKLLTCLFSHHVLWSLAPWIEPSVRLSVCGWVQCLTRSGDLASLEWRWGLCHWLPALDTAQDETGNKQLEGTDPLQTNCSHPD